MDKAPAAGRAKHPAPPRKHRHARAQKPRGKQAAKAAKPATPALMTAAAPTPPKQAKTPRTQAKQMPAKRALPKQTSAKQAQAKQTQTKRAQTKQALPKQMPAKQAQAPRQGRAAALGAKPAAAASGKRAKQAPAPAQRQKAQVKQALAPQAPAQTAAPAAKTALPAAKAKAAPPETQNTGFRREMLALLPSLRAFAVSLARRADRADDLLQDTIMRAWAKQESFTQGTNMKAWLFTILRNEFYSQMRRQNREVQDTDSYFANNLAVHPAQYGSLDLQDFKQALDKLPADQREAIILIGASGFSYEEAADICGCALGTIKSRVSRARTKLQNLLGIEGESDYGPDAASASSTLRSF